MDQVYTLLGEKMHIDGTNLILGRVASVAAKHALLGEQVTITNCEKIVISGTRRYAINHYLDIHHMGNPMNGPFLPRLPDRFVKRVCKRMLPIRRARGKAALRRIRCYIGLPKEVQESSTHLASAHKNKLPTLQMVSIGNLCFALGGKR